MKDAPRINADGDLTDAEQDRIFDYYGLGSTTSTTGAGYDTTDTAADYTSTDTTHGAGHDTSGPNTDDAMTRKISQR